MRETTRSRFPVAPSTTTTDGKALRTLEVSLDADVEQGNMSQVATGMVADLQVPSKTSVFPLNQRTRDPESSGEGISGERREKDALGSLYVVERTTGKAREK